MAGPYRVLGISGSLRQDSYNTAALRAARALAPSGEFRYYARGRAGICTSGPWPRLRRYEWRCRR